MNANNEGGWKDSFVVYIGLSLVAAAEDLFWLDPTSAEPVLAPLSFPDPYKGPFSVPRSHFASQSKGHDPASNILVIAPDEES